MAGIVRGHLGSLGRSACDQRAGQDPGFEHPILQDSSTIEGTVPEEDGDLLSEGLASHDQTSIVIYGVILHLQGDIGEE